MHTFITLNSMKTMLTHTTQDLRIYFGNQLHSLNLDQVPTLQHHGICLDDHPFAPFAQHNSLQSLFFGNQIHATDGIEVTPHLVHTTQPFTLDGDFLITNHTGIGLGVLTGDCIPIVMYDNHVHCMSVIHAGWRGSVAGILKKALDAMTSTYGSKPSTISIIFGPAARGCCYEIGSDVVDQLMAFPWGPQTITIRNGRAYADMVTFNACAAQTYGIAQSTIITTFADCTICNKAYCSYRRQGKTANRQMSIAVLRC